jgi:hypothetical protein
MLDDLKAGRERSAIEVQLFRTMGIDETQQRIIHDLAFRGAEQAIDSAKIVAKTAPEQWMVYPVLLVSLLLCSHAVNAEIKDHCERQLSHLDPKTRAAFEEIVRATRESSKVTVRDFDGNYR